MNGTQLYIPRLTPLNKCILIGAGSCFLLQSLAEKWLEIPLWSLFGLSPNTFWNGHLYQMLTYPLVQMGLMPLLFDGLVIWFIGSELEQLWGGKSYLRFLLVSVFSAGAFYSLLALLFHSRFPLVGITGISYALLLSYSVLFPRRILTFMLIFPMQAKYFCLLLIGILLFSGLMSHNPSSWGHLGAMMGAFGHMYAVTLYRQGKNPWMGLLKKSSQKKKGNLYIIKNDEEKGPKYWQ